MIGSTLLVLFMFLFFLTMVEEIAHDGKIEKKEAILSYDSLK